MITIPESIKNLLKSDSVYKNFRAHFPNGERADITNDNIVSESVNLTESICSQQTLMFNTCETPQIEFETIGVENIKGAVIECSLEIECPSTVSGAVQRADLNNMWVYPIPYGKFVINSCKKQADMSHRQVIAYNYGIYHEGLSPLEQELQRRRTGRAEPYNIVPYPFLVTNGLVEPDNYTVYNYDTISRNNTVNVPYQNNYLTNYLVQINIVYRYATGSPYARSATLFQIKDCRTQFADAIQFCVDTINEWVSEYGLTPLTTRPNEYQKYLSPILKVISGEFGGDYYWKELYEKYPSDYYMTLAYPLETRSDGMMMPISFDIKLIGGSVLDSKSYTIISDYSDLIKTINIYGYGLTDIEVSGTNVSDINKLIGATYELQGKICRMNRQSIVEPLSIKERLANPVETLTPSNYSEFWYDDDMTKPYGLITCSYKDDSGEDAYAEKYMVDEEDFNTKDYKAYDISNNLIIKGNQFSATTIEDILDTMASNMDAISYMPLNLTTKGRPDIEVGDVLTIESREGDEIPCLIMQRNLNGIMALEDSITATEDDEDISTLQLNSAFDSASGTLSISLVGGR